MRAESLTETQLRLYALGYEALTGAPPERTDIWELDEITERVSVVDGARPSASRAPAGSASESGAATSVEQW